MHWDRLDLGTSTIPREGPVAKKLANLCAAVGWLSPASVWDHPDGSLKAVEEGFRGYWDAVKLRSDAFAEFVELSDGG